MDEKTINSFNGRRISGRQIDELIGLSRGLLADGKINQQEVEFLQTWLAANRDITDNPIISILYDRVAGVMADGVADPDECIDLFDTLHQFVDGGVALGEPLESSTLPLCRPAPAITFAGKRYCFTGTFTYGGRSDCEQAAKSRSAITGGIAQKTDVLVIGGYATES